MIKTHLAKLRARDHISRDEEGVIRDALGEALMIPADTIVTRAGDRLTNSTLLLEGLMCRSKDLPGGERQITDLHVPGDFLDLHSFSLKQLDHNVIALTPCHIVRMPHAALLAITRDHPHLTRVYWFHTTLDAAIHREWVLSLGRRNAIQRIAHLMCELRVRLGLVGMADDSGFDLPLTQSDLSDCAGLTPVHVNRTLRELRERGLMEFRGRRVSIVNMTGLIALAEFDDNYLYLRHEDR